ncbi:hypothetical protein CEUSTIGMA_g5913.t1 [Chlamydomonas eustigma]|uniref:Uncharacterized protein n=1 Tax=Chlamydomonas eustigma TaxID=1157962 RepID=A0A250X5V9_9CHLO|nr:hypothetical protein CEUSTIGMA_g5913.t1 [Chlamydomonas eustigma]|eukprot:GAX78474.1 hypothetical protein CEUSTIGMA_g5913.t1 [Chlamydomonas eustigma]
MMVRSQDGSEGEPDFLPPQLVFKAEDTGLKHPVSLSSGLDAPDISSPKDKCLGSLWKRQLQKMGTAMSPLKQAIRDHDHRSTTSEKLRTVPRPLQQQLISGHTSFMPSPLEVVGQVTPSNLIQVEDSCIASQLLLTTSINPAATSSPLTTSSSCVPLPPGALYSTAVQAMTSLLDQLQQSDDYLQADTARSWRSIESAGGSCESTSPLRSVLNIASPHKAFDATAKQEGQGADGADMQAGAFPASVHTLAVPFSATLQLSATLMPCSPMSSISNSPLTMPSDTAFNTHISQGEDEDWEGNLRLSFAAAFNPLYGSVVWDNNVTQSMEAEHLPDSWSSEPDIPLAPGGISNTYLRAFDLEGLSSEEQQPLVPVSLFQTHHQTSNRAAVESALSQVDIPSVAESGATASAWASWEDIKRQAALPTADCAVVDAPGSPLTATPRHASPRLEQSLPTRCEIERCGSKGDVVCVEVCPSGINGGSHNPAVQQPLTCSQAGLPHYLHGLPAVSQVRVAMPLLASSGSGGGVIRGPHHSLPLSGSGGGVIRGPHHSLPLTPVFGHDGDSLTAVMPTTPYVDQGGNVVPTPWTAAAVLNVPRSPEEPNSQHTYLNLLYTWKQQQELVGRGTAAAASDVMPPAGIMECSEQQLPTPGVDALLLSNHISKDYYSSDECDLGTNKVPTPTPLQITTCTQIVDGFGSPLCQSDGRLTISPPAASITAEPTHEDVASQLLPVLLPAALQEGLATQTRQHAQLLACSMVASLDGDDHEIIMFELQDTFMDIEGYSANDPASPLTPQTADLIMRVLQEGGEGGTCQHLIQQLVMADLPGGSSSSSMAAHCSKVEDDTAFHYHDTVTIDTVISPLPTPVRAAVAAAVLEGVQPQQLILQLLAGDADPSKAVEPGGSVGQETVHEARERFEGIEDTHDPHEVTPDSRIEAIEDDVDERVDESEGKDLLPELYWSQSPFIPAAVKVFKLRRTCAPREMDVQGGLSSTPIELSGQAPWRLGQAPLESPGATAHLSAATDESAGPGAPKHHSEQMLQEGICVGQLGASLPACADTLPLSGPEQPDIPHDLTLDDRNVSRRASESSSGSCLLHEACMKIKAAAGQDLSNISIALTSGQGHTESSLRTLSLVTATRHIIDEMLLLLPTEEGTSGMEPMSSQHQTSGFHVSNHPASLTGATLEGTTQAGAPLVVGANLEKTTLEGTTQAGAARQAVAIFEAACVKGANVEGIALKGALDQQLLLATAAEEWSGWYSASFTSHSECPFAEATAAARSSAAVILALPETARIDAQEVSLPETARIDAHQEVSLPEPALSEQQGGPLVLVLDKSSPQRRHADVVQPSCQHAEAVMLSQELQVVRVLDFGCCQGMSSPARNDPAEGPPLPLSLGAFPLCTMHDWTQPGQGMRQCPSLSTCPTSLHNDHDALTPSPPTSLHNDHDALTPTPAPRAVLGAVRPVYSTMTPSMGWVGIKSLGHTPDLSSFPPVAEDMAALGIASSLSMRAEASHSSHTVKFGASKDHGHVSTHAEWRSADDMEQEGPCWTSKSPPTSVISTEGSSSGRKRMRELAHVLQVVEVGSTQQSPLLCGSPTLSNHSASLACKMAGHAAVTPAEAYQDHGHAQSSSQLTTCYDQVSGGMGSFSSPDAACTNLHEGSRERSVRRVWGALKDSISVGWNGLTGSSSSSENILTAGSQSAGSKKLLSQPLRRTPNRAPGGNFWARYKKPSSLTHRYVDFVSETSSPVKTTGLASSTAMSAAGGPSESRGAVKSLLPEAPQLSRKVQLFTPSFLHPPPFTTQPRGTCSGIHGDINAESFLPSAIEAPTNCTSEATMMIGNATTADRKMSKDTNETAGSGCASKPFDFTVSRCPLLLPTAPSTSNSSSGHKKSSMSSTVASRAEAPSSPWDTIITEYLSSGRKNRRVTTDCS